MSLGDGNEDGHSLLSYCYVQLWQVPAGSLHSPSILFIFLLVLAHIVSLVNSLLCKPSPHFSIFNSLSSIPNLNLLLNTIRSGKNSKFIFFQSELAALQCGEPRQVSHAVRSGFTGAVRSSSREAGTLPWRLLFVHVSVLVNGHSGWTYTRIHP